MKLTKAAETLRSRVEETLAYMALLREHWTRLRTNNALERLMREIRRRTRVVGNFPDGQSTMMLVAARLRDIARTWLGTHALPASVSSCVPPDCDERSCRVHQLAINR